MGTRFVHRGRAVGAAAVVFLGAGGVAIPVVAPLASVRPVPFSAGHIEAKSLTSPPSTADCQALFGINCYNPTQFRVAYNLNGMAAHGLDGTGRTIVIVDSFGSPTIAHDLHAFDQQYGLPDPPSLQTIAPAGAIPAFDPNDDDMVGWAQETTLDVEWSHAMAPGANILIVATPVSETEGVTGFPEIVAAENYVIDHNLGDVISQSFGATEQTFAHKADILGLRSAFKNAARHHVTVLGSSGDTGSTDYFLDLSCCYPYPVTSWPSSDPLVTSVGGTQLHLDAAGNRLSPDVVWNDGFGSGGGGLSTVFRRPDFQDGVRKIVGGARGTPDVSLSAAVDGGVIVYYSFIRPTSPWHIFGGTSEASPLLAGIIAIADQAAGHRLGNINSALYEMSGEDGHGGIVDVTSGDNSFTFCQSDCGLSTEVDVTVPGYPALKGYDLSSGVGTIDGQRFVRALAHRDD